MQEPEKTAPGSGTERLSAYMKETIHSLALSQNSAEDIARFAENYTRLEQPKKTS
ncbi:MULTISPECIES: hypothetical protein [Caproicibacterium]|uniref:Uncharacterized protein n=1 Tax=Caproicibacterium argilliputei TaxID=3030016 RepID=A0AA97H4A0_9FIRM|nr:hypothetical protein [Caproicibacterium argilliputei]WOC33168.1 hypothetical protein PXC00_04650 [Caproicibacterium argilliputei]